MQRRQLLMNFSHTLLGAGTLPLWLQRASAASPQRRHVLVVIFQRGAMDGLSAVVPFHDEHYQKKRPTLALATQELLKIHDDFALHPAFAPLARLFQDQRLAIVQATGSTHATRSHFDAQDFMESGTPGVKSTRDGWLNRSLPRTAPALQAVAFGPTLPRVLRGAAPAVAIDSMQRFRVPSAQSEELMAMYRMAGDTQVRQAGQEAFAAAAEVEKIQRTAGGPANGARYPDSRLGSSLQQIAVMIRAGCGMQSAFAECGGWDTHVNQQRTLNNLLKDMAESIGAFVQDLGESMNEVTLVTMSEFGRTVAENGSRGTDHGHGSFMMLAGQGVQGGQLYGEWPGLAPEQLHEGRDLQVTTDFRAVLSLALQQHAPEIKLEQVFPGYQVLNKSKKTLDGLFRS
jgi:uncharacterized protein (DUF1501 family)